MDVSDWLPAVVFGVLLAAALAKIRAWVPWRRAIDQLFDRRLATVALFGVPAVESLIACVGLAIAPKVAAVGAAILFASFGSVLLWSRGRRPDASCGCFGSVLAPIDLWTVSRAYVLTATALLSATVATTPTWRLRFETAMVFIVVVTHVRLRQRSPRKGADLVVELYVARGCPSCQRLLEELPIWENLLPDTTTVVVRDVGAGYEDAVRGVDVVPQGVLKAGRRTIDVSRGRESVMQMLTGLVKPLAHDSTILTRRRLFAWLAVLTSSLAVACGTKRPPKYSTPIVAESCEAFNTEIALNGFEFEMPDGTKEQRPGGRGGTTGTAFVVHIEFGAKTVETKELPAVICKCNGRVYQTEEGCYIYCGTVEPCAPAICVGGSETCVHRDLRLRYEVDPLFSRRAEWKPSREVSKQCLAAAADYHRRVDAHEAQHRAQAQSAVDLWNKDHTNATTINACAATAAQAEVKYQQAVAELDNRAGEEVEKLRSEYKRRSANLDNVKEKPIDCSQCP